jgi:hypothetical protein
MKTRTALKPSDFKCPGKGPSLKANWCYKIVKNKGPKKGFVVQVNTRVHLIVGHMSENCQRVTGTGSERKAKVFESARAANQAVQKCILKPRGK